MKYEELVNLLQNIGKDPSRLIFEDELTGIYNRRFLLHYFQYKIAWDALQDHPLSLIMMDMDRFKDLNDNYGHQAGDQALVWLAGLLKEMAGEQGLPVRYAGDEFMILLPSGEKNEALQVGERLLKRVREERLPISKKGNGRVRVTLSMGIASAPEDAQTGRGLIQKADTALYYAKKQGRDCLANAGTVPLQDVFAQTALYQLQEEKIAGRREQLSQISELLNYFGQVKKGQFIIVEGASGMGKSTFLETIRANLARSKAFPYAKISGIPQELFRPYYMATRLLVELMNDKEDKGVGILESLDPQEISYLAKVLPQLPVGEKSQPIEDERAIREGIFNTLGQFIPKLMGDQPLVLLIDDLHFADEASLLIFRHLILRQQSPLFLCCTVAEPLPIILEEHSVPLHSFFRDQDPVLGLIKIKLTPLAAHDIFEHLQGIFPRLKVPENFEKDLEQITQGNPLFLGEILSKLVLDQKISLTGQQWVIEPLEKDDLPKSLEAIISQKISDLDEESRQLLYQASTFGEDVPLSLLGGSSKIMESKVLEFVDQAVRKGLLQTDFEVNDQKIHFRGKRILEIAEKDLQPKQKQELHERVGSYQETLFQKLLLPSAAPLVYHFSRSANQEKAKTYRQYEVVYNYQTFNPGEAIQYSGERRRDLPPPGTPLDPESLAQVPSFFRSVLTALRNIQLYPSGSELVYSSYHQVREALEKILQKNEDLTVFQVQNALMINGQKVDVSEFKWVTEELIKLFNRLDLQGIIFKRGITPQEVSVLLETFGLSKPKILDKDFWHRFAEEKKLVHVELKQIRYTIRVETDGQVRIRKRFKPVAGAPPQKVTQRLFSEDQKLDGEEIKQIPEILRALLSAGKAIKLYPLNSKNVSTSLEQLLVALRLILPKRQALTLAQVSGSLLVNGVKIDTSGIEAVVEGFLKFLYSLKLTSLTFLENLSLQELKTFLGALTEIPPAQLGSDFWQRFAKKQRLLNLLFDQVLYESGITSLSGHQEPDETVLIEEEVAQELLEGLEPIEEELLDSFLKEMSSQLPDLLLEIDENPAKVTIQQLFLVFQDRPLVTREKIVESIRRLLEELTPALQPRFARLLTLPVLAVFQDERDPKILREIAALLYRMATPLIQFGWVPPASRILLQLHKRQKQLEEMKDPQAQRLAKILDRKLDPTVQKFITEDFKSGEGTRHQNAALLLGSLGRATLPLLLEVIKNTEDLRVRLVAANLMGKMGPESGNLLKREFMAEGNPEVRVRILEVIELVTRDLKTELAFGFGSENPKIRQAAFRLAERLNDPQAIELLLDHARGKDIALAVEAIECVGRMKPASSTGVLTSLLERRKKTDRLKACCCALGQIADPASIEPLVKILTRRGIFSRYKKENAEVRASAAFALDQIPHPRAVEVLASLESDPDPRIREIAQKSLKKLPSFPPRPQPTSKAGRTQKGRKNGAVFPRR